MYIGGLIVNEKPCNCNAPFAETYVTTTGKIGVILWEGITEKHEDDKMLYDTNPDNEEQGEIERDDLGMRCTRCGVDAIMF